MQGRDNWRIMQKKISSLKFSIWSFYRFTVLIEIISLRIYKTFYIQTNPTTSSSYKSIGLKLFATLFQPLQNKSIAFVILLFYTKTATQTTLTNILMKKKIPIFFFKYPYKNIKNSDWHWLIYFWPFNFIYSITHHHNVCVWRSCCRLRRHSVRSIDLCNTHKYQNVRTTNHETKLYSITIYKKKNTNKSTNRGAPQWCDVRNSSQPQIEFSCVCVCSRSRAFMRVTTNASGS